MASHIPLTARAVNRDRRRFPGGLRAAAARRAARRKMAVLKLRQDRAWALPKNRVECLAWAGSTVHRILREHGISNIQVPRKTSRVTRWPFPASSRT